MIFLCVFSIRTSMSLKTDRLLEQIINNDGTLAWQKLKNTFSEKEYSQIKLEALTRLKNESSLLDTEYRTMILAKKVTP